MKRTVLTLLLRVGRRHRRRPPALQQDRHGQAAVGRRGHDHLQHDAGERDARAERQGRRVRVAARPDAQALGGAEDARRRRSPPASTRSA